MAAEKLFEVMAGISADYFSIGGVQFYAAPFTLMEYATYQALPENDLGAKAEFIAEKLQVRIRGTKAKAAEITTDWVMENVPLPTMRLLQHILIYGEKPRDGTPGKS
ncbi:hypothetical protein [Deinococcus navajonensis]|uniref:Uncharacterized protein n=1 Tax=Deinococcus navajonensis TaxID=309884 RepID=A0ABV8XTV5_9DEIO